MPRIFVESPLSVGKALLLEGASARHMQVLRLQPGHEVTLFNGEGGEYLAHIERMGRSDVAVRVAGFSDREAEAALRVHLLVGAPANERMDWLIEKATELGAASVWPVLTERSVVRLSGERAEKKTVHWQGVAQAACEQCGRNRVPVVHPMRALRELLPVLPMAQGRGVYKRVLSLQEAVRPGGGAWNEVAQAPSAADVWVLNGPEGGLSSAEEEFATAHGFVPASLGPRVLRAETAALAALMRVLAARD